MKDAMKPTMKTTVLVTLLAAGCAAAPPAPPPLPAAAAEPATPPPSVAIEPTPAVQQPTGGADEDPYLWLEEVTSERALAWAHQMNQKSQPELERGLGFAPLRERILAILDSKDKIPYVGKLGAHYYNFWKDEKNPRGLWRRTTLASYRTPQPKWETVIDVDEVARADKESWVWRGEQCLYPKRERCLITLSPGGSDASIVREFDTRQKSFVAGGFSLPVAKSRVAWKDLDTIYVGTDFGSGSLTESGYPRIVKEWKRGTPLADAKVVFEGTIADIRVSAHRSWDHGRVRDFVTRGLTFFTNEVYLRQGDKLLRIDVPTDATVGTWDDQILIRLRSDWDTGGKTWPKGAYLATAFDAFMRGGRDFTMLFEPSANRSFAGAAELKTALIVNELEDVKNRLYVWTRKGKKWLRKAMPGPAMGSFRASPVEANDSDDYWFTATDFTTPTTLSLGTLGNLGNSGPAPLKQTPSHFDATALEVQQHFATSRDGTRVPYFQVARKDMRLDGNNATWFTAYGGFESSLEPSYAAVTGAAWLERGGVFVQGNIRGGGEYGPGWHQAALKTNRQRAYDDFIAIAEDLIRRKVTSPARLGIQGGSNGGLLMGVMLTQRPDLFGAIVCSVPLLDMKRYHKLLAGASWVAEYGSPDVQEEWAAIARYSPYQNVKKGRKYPRTLFTTSTRDDRVHPGHARKMVARMLEQGHDVLYYENIEGGHGGAANNQQAAYRSAISFTFVARQLGLGAGG